jgi:acyl-CoA synthetase (AMP-forming)/AMP-acid ligase II
MGRDRKCPPSVPVASTLLKNADSPRRLKELIIRGGQNIAPAEVEEVVNTFEAVAGAAHPHLGEVPILFVVA